MAKSMEEEAGWEFIDGLARGLDPLAYDNPDTRDRMRRHRRVLAKVRIALTEYGRLASAQRPPQTYEQWVKETVMNPRLERTERPDPMIGLLLELAALLNPNVCGELTPETYKPELLTDAQHYTIVVANGFLQKVCRVMEQEYASFLFQRRSTAA